MYPLVYHTILRSLYLYLLNFNYYYKYSKSHFSYECNL